MGKLAKSAGASRSAPSAADVLWTRASAASTRCSVSTMSTFQSKNRSISAEPRLVTERTSSRPGHRYRLLERAGDRHHHLVDRHHAVVDADDDAGKLVVGKTAIGIVNAK